ncbi:hypothetical protein V6Z12_D04G024800 [Gossypium hirsutum]
MATAREEGNPYDGAQGAGGKFKKRPFRRTTKTTPYDRPPTSIRNPSGSSNENGWLSKLVDPARRLITSSAHRLFASVFTKRLPPPPPPTPQLLDSETNREPTENQLDTTSTVPPVVQGDIIECENPTNHSGKGGVAELEEILKQKTFTRSEIDLLTSLLRSRTVDITGGNEEKRSEMISVVSHDKKEDFLESPVRENGTENHLILTPVARSTVPDEDVASPAELAKAYMGSRPSKVSTSMHGLQNQVPRRDLSSPSNKIFPSKSSITSLVPRSSGHVGSLGNGFMTPRSQGRSAIYSMARTPYSRVNSSTLIKSVGTDSDAFGGPLSSSQGTWEHNRISGSGQGVLSRSSVLDNDIGSVGPIRRIRQKSSLLSSRNLTLPASAAPLSAHVVGTSSAGLDTLAETGGNSSPGTSFTTVPSKSSQMASKIFQQLEMLVSPGEKSPSMLSPSMLCGQARKSLVNVDSSKFLENVHDSSKSVVQLSQEKSQAFQISAHEDYLDLDDGHYSIGATPARFGEWREKSDNSVNGSKRAASEAVVEKPSIFSEVMPISSAAVNRNPGMRTSNGSPVVEKNSSITFPVVQVANSSMQSAFLGSQSTQAAKKDAFSTESNAPPMVSIGEKVAPVQLDAAVTTFGFASRNVGEVLTITGSSGVKLAKSSDQELDFSSRITNSGSNVLDYWTPETALTSAVSTSNFKFGASADCSAVNNGSFSSSSFSFSSPVPYLVPSNGRSSSSATANNNDSPATATTSASATVNPTICHTSIPSVETSIPSFTASPVFKFSSSGDPSTSREATKSKTQDTSLGNVGIFPCSSTFAFTCSGSSAVSSTTGTTAVFTSSGNSSFSGTCSTITNSGSGFFSSTFTTVMGTGSSIFGSSSSTTSTCSSIFGGTSLPVAGTGNSTFSTKSAITGSGSNIFGFGAPAAPTSTALTQGLNPFNAVDTQASAAGTGIGSSTHSTPIQFSSSASSPSFGLGGNATFSSGTSIFGSSASVAKPFSSGASFGTSSSSSETNSLSSSSGIAAGAFGSNWQAPKTLTFGSSSGFSFGSSTSVSAPSSAPTIFGSSTGASSSSIFSFTSAAAATPSQPVFGNTSPGLVFGSTPSSNNDQMEDSMAEDTVQASPTVVTFSQQPISSPASGFVFGASNPSGAGSVQFGGQTSIGAPQNPSPFLASGSVEFGAGGSFSLGTGGSDKSARKFVKVRKQRRDKSS